jgi:hypothetical protein
MVKYCENRWFKGENSLIYLINLVKKAVVFNYNIRDPERTKNLDVITKNLVVPSRNGWNYASNLQLWKFKYIVFINIGILIIMHFTIIKFFAF